MYDGYAPEPMTEIVPGRLYLGNMADANNIPLLHERGIKSIMSVCQFAPKKAREQPFVRVHVPLVDGPNEPEIFALAVALTARLLLASERPMLVHCRGGVSRSPAVLAAAMIIVDGYGTFDKAVDKLAAKRSIVNPHEALRKLAREYLGER